MNVVTFQGISDALGSGLRVGSLRTTLIESLEKLIDEFGKEMNQREADIRTAWGDDLNPLQAAFNDLLDESDRLPKVHDLVAATYDMARLTDQAAPLVEQALTDLIDVAHVDGARDVLPANLAQSMKAISSRKQDPKQQTSAMLRLSRRAPRSDVLSRKLAHWTFLRLWAMHGHILLSASSTKPVLDDDAADKVSEHRASVEQRVRDLRNGLQSVANQLRVSGRATPVHLVSLLAAVREAESWIRSEGAAKVGSSCAAATAAVGENSSDALRIGRDAALVYDGVRTLLALLSGAHSVLRAYSCLDDRELARFATSSTLPVSTATLNLPRSSVAQAAAAPAGEPVETAALVLDTSVTVGGPAPRTVLRIGSQSGAQLQVLLPFTAADSFGITSGIWVQVRGRIYPEGKDDLTGPVLEVRRIQREVAAAASFFDAMVWAGRHEFEYRPAQLDIVAGRRAGDLTAAVELGLRR